MIIPYTLILNQFKFIDYRMKVLIIIQMSTNKSYINPKQGKTTENQQPGKQLSKNNASQRTGSGELAVPALRSNAAGLNVHSNNDLQATYFNQTSSRVNKNEGHQHENYSARSQNKQSQAASLSVQMSAKQGSRDRRVDRASGLTTSNLSGSNIQPNLQPSGGTQRGMAHSNTTWMNNRAAGQASLFNAGSRSKHQKQLSTQMQQDSHSTGGLNSGAYQKVSGERHAAKTATSNFPQQSVEHEIKEPTMAKQQSADQAASSGLGGTQHSNRLNQHAALSTVKMKSGFSTSRNNTGSGNGQSSGPAQQSTDQIPNSMTLKNQRAMSKGLRGPPTMSNTVGNRLSNNSMIAQGSGMQRNPESILSISNQISKARLSPKNQNSAPSHAVFRNQQSKQQQSQSSAAGLINQTHQPQSNRTSGFGMQNNGGSSVNLVGADPNSRMSDQNKKGGRTFQNQNNSNMKKRMNNDSGDEGFGDQQGFSSNRENQLEERTQLEIDNTQGLSITWFIKKLQKIQKMNKSLDSSDSFEIEPHELIALLPVPDCDDDIIMATELDIDNQRTIKVDSERTRVSEMKGLHGYSVLKKKQVFNLDEATLRTEKTLTFYQMQRKTNYIQGPNEILGSFIWLAHKDKIFEDEIACSRQEQSLIQNPLTASLQAMHLFIDTFLPTMFLDDNFVCLQSCFCLLRLLLKYHDPAICNVLSSNSVDPQLYAMKWFFTMFSQQCERVDIVLDLWARLLHDKNEGSFASSHSNSSGQWWKRRGVLNMSVALIIMNRERILNCDRSELFGLMTNLCLSSKSHIDKLFQIAEDIYNKTPISFWESEEINILFGENSQTHYKSKLKHEDRIQMHLRLENFQCIPITNSEFFKNIYPDFADHLEDFHSSKRMLVGPPRYQCPNPKCFRFHQIQMMIRQENQKDEKSGADKNEDTFLYQQRYAKHLSETCQQIFAPYSNDNNFNFFRDFSTINTPTNSNSNNVLSHLEQISNQLQKGPLLIGNIMHLHSGIDDQQQQPQDQWVVLEQNGGSPEKTVQQQSLSEQLVNSYRQAGIDLKNINQYTRFPDGPSFAELCDDCKSNRMSIDSEKHNQSLRLIIIDCRALMLQKEAMLPGSAQFEITNSCDKRNLLNQVRQRFDDCKDQVHICLLGLNPQEVPRDYKEANDFIGQSNFGQSPLSNKQLSQTDDNLDIRDFHDKVLKFIIEMFYRESFKYISFLPGGFEQCHQFIKQENATILHQFIEKLIDYEDALRKGEVPPKRNLSQQPHFFELVDPHYHNNCYHCAMEPNDPILESKIADTTRASGQSRISLQTPSRLNEQTAMGQRRAANYSATNNIEAADIESTVSSGQHKPNSLNKEGHDQKASQIHGNNIAGGQQVKASNISRFTQHLTGNQRFGRANQAQKNIVNTFEINKEANDTEDSQNKYDLKVFKIKSNYTPLAGIPGQLTSSQISNQNYYNQAYGFSTSEFDSKIDYIESEGNQNHPQQEGNLDIFQGFRNWWHVNITNNSRLLGGLGLGDHVQAHGNVGHKNNQDRRNGRGNASSPTVMDPKAGLYGKSGKAEGMHLMNMTQITRSDIRSKQQKNRDSNSNSNVQLHADMDYQRDHSNTLVFNDSNPQSSGDYPRSREIMPQSIFGNSSQNFNNSLPNNRQNDNLSGRQNHLRTSNISDQQRKISRPGHQIQADQQKNIDKKKGQLLQQHLNSNLINYQSNDNADFNNTNNESSQYVSFGQSHQIQSVAANELPMQIHAARRVNLQNSPSPPRSGTQQTKMNDYRTSMQGAQQQHQGISSNYQANLRSANQYGKSNFLPQGPGTGSRAHYQHHKSERKQQSFFEDFENAEEEEHDEQRVQSGHHEYGGADQMEDAFAQPQDDHHRNHQEQIDQERSFAFNEKPNIGLRISNNQRTDQLGMSEENKALKQYRAKIGDSVMEQNDSKDRLNWNRGIQGRHPSVSNDNEGLDRAFGHKRGADRGQSAVAIGGRSRIGITDRTNGDLDRLSTDQKLAHKSIHKNDNAANITKVNNFLNQSVGNKESDRLSKEKEELKNLVSNSLQGKGSKDKLDKRAQQRKQTFNAGTSNKPVTTTESNIESNTGQSSKSKGMGSVTPSYRESQASSQFQLEERSYYLCNGIQKQQSYEGWHEDVQRIIEQDALQTPNDIVIYHVKRLASSHLQQLIQHQQMIQTSQSQTGQTAGSGPTVSNKIFGHDSKNPSITSIIITQFTTVCLCQAFSFIQSRFFMHDLIKITSRKSSAKIITFYFRIPQFGEYNTNYFKTVEYMPDPNDKNAATPKENVILSTYNQNPNIPYQFAYKRKKYHEVKMGFEFKTEEEARDCIERVSILYKRLKNSYKEDATNNSAAVQQSQSQLQSQSTTQGKEGSTTLNNISETIDCEKEY